MMSSPKKVLNRPKKRTLVRWDDNLDELLLLTIQSVCNKNSVKIPWGEVADTMGNNVTEGAIIQHLAKLRSRRVAAHKEIPPPLRRGGVGSSMKPTTGKRRRSNEAVAPSEVGEESPAPLLVIDNSSDEDYVEGHDLKMRRKRISKMKPQHRNHVAIKTDPESESESESEGEFLVPGAAFLSLPNDRNAVPSCSSSDSSDSSEEEEEGTKVVVLRYRTRSDTSKATSNAHNGQEPTTQMPCTNNVFNHAIEEQRLNQYGPGWYGNHIGTPYNLNQYDLGPPAFDTSNEVYSLPGTTLQSFSGGQQDNTLDLPGHDDFFNNQYCYENDDFWTS